MKNLRVVLQAFRRDIPDQSLTAQAIDRGALLEEISQVAALERVHELATLLFEAEQEDLQDNPDREIDLRTLIDGQIHQLRTQLPNESKTANSRRRKSQRRTDGPAISQIAREDRPSSYVGRDF